MKTQNYSGINSNYAGSNTTVLLLVVFFTAILFLFPDKFPERDYTIARLLSTGLISVSALIIIRYLKNQPVKAAVQSVFILAFFSVFFGVTSDFQLVIHNQWQDEKLLALDNNLFGSEVSLLMESIVCRYLTEAMMFAYVFYIPLLIFAAFVAYKSGSTKGLGEYLFILSLGYAFCFVGFILFPVASQMYYSPHKYTVALEGGIFTFLGELIRNKTHFPGGSLPSPHCTASTIVLFSLRKYNRNIFYLVLPVVMIIYVSTVYGRYHYIWDGITGIILAVLLVKLLPLFQGMIDKINTFYRSLMNPISISDSLSENEIL